jgi:hypothetical protein
MMALLSMGNTIYLFEHYEHQPEALRTIVDTYTEKLDSGDEDNYKICCEFKRTVEKKGFTMDFGLDAEPYSLRPIEFPFRISPEDWSKLSGFQQNAIKTQISDIWSFKQLSKNVQFTTGYTAVFETNESIMAVVTNGVIQATSKPVWTINT